MAGSTRKGHEVTDALRETVDRGLVSAVVAPFIRGDDLQSALDSCVHEIAVRIGGDLAGVWLLDDGEETLGLRARAGAILDVGEHHLLVPVGHYKIGMIATERSPHLTNDVLHDPRISDVVWARREDVVAFAGYPLTIGDRLIGVLAMFSRSPLDQRALDALESVADLVALGIDRTRKEVELAVERQMVEALYEIGTAISAELELDRIVQLVTHSATALTGAEFGAFFYNVVSEAGESYTMYALSGVDPELFAGFPLPRNTPIFHPTYSGGPPVRSDDITVHPDYGQRGPYHGMPEGHLPVRSYLAVAVTARSGEPIGGLFFGHAGRGRFDARHERAVVAIAQQAAVAFEHAALYSSAEEIALTLQQSLLPQSLPTIAGATLAARYSASGRHAEVGGDWYDVDLLPDGVVLLTVGDVAGHDITAAARMGQLRSALRAYSFETTQPAQSIQRLDQFMTAADLRSMATLLHARFDPSTRTMTMCRAGHLPPLSIHPDLTVEFLSVPVNPPVGCGLLVSNEPVSRTVVLEPGSAIVLYTDGLIERRGETLDDGLVRLRDTVSAVAGADPDAICDHLLEVLGQDLSDDVALLVLRVGDDA